MGLVMYLTGIARGSIEEFAKHRKTEILSPKQGVLTNIVVIKNTYLLRAHPLKWN